MLAAARRCSAFPPLLVGVKGVGRPLFTLSGRIDRLFQELDVNKNRTLDAQELVPLYKALAKSVEGITGVELTIEEATEIVQAGHIHRAISYTVLW